MKLKIKKSILRESIMSRFQKQIDDRNKKIRFIKSRMNSQTDQQKKQSLQQIEKLQDQLRRLITVIRSKK